MKTILLVGSGYISRAICDYFSKIENISLIIATNVLKEA